MIVLEDGSVYLAKGERFPMKCPHCTAFIPYQNGLSATCPKCGHEDCAEEFCNAEFVSRPVQ